MLALFVIVAIVVKRMIQSQGATDAKALRCDMLKDSGEVSVADTERVRKERWEQVLRCQQKKDHLGCIGHSTAWIFSVEGVHYRVLSRRVM